MTTVLNFKLDDPKWIISKGTIVIDVLVDKQVTAKIKFGDSVELRLTDGPHAIETILRNGWITRNSSPLHIDDSKGKPLSVFAKYSRIWGNFVLEHNRI